MTAPSASLPGLQGTAALLPRRLLRRADQRGAHALPTVPLVHPQALELGGLRFVDVQDASADDGPLLVGDLENHLFLPGVLGNRHGFKGLFPNILYVALPAGADLILHRLLR